MSARADVVPRERSVVAGAFGLMVLHNLDEAFVHPEDGGALNLAMALVVSAVVLALLPRMHRWVRVVVFGFLGLQGVSAGVAGHVVHLVRGDAVPLDWSGILFVLGGVLLLGLAVAEARPRRAPAPTDLGGAASPPAVAHH